MVPDGWKFRPLEEVAHSVHNGFVGKVSHHYVEDGIPYLMAKNIRDNRIEVDDLEIVSREFKNDNPRSVLEARDIVTVQSGHIGTSATIPPELAGSSCHALIITRPIHEKVDSDFIAYYFNSPPGRKRLSDIFIGTTIKHINTKDLKKFVIPIPPLEEQKKIVEILGSVDESIASTQAVIDQTRKVKQGLLQQLLTKGIGHTKFKESAIGKIPESWEVVKLKSLLSQSIQNGYSPVCPKDYTGSWILSLGAVNPEGLNIKAVKPAPKDDLKVSDFLLKPGDFLVSRSNTRDRVGFSVLYRGEIENCSYPDLLMRFRINNSLMVNEFLEYFLISPKALEYLQASAAGTSGSMVKINKTVLESLIVPVPSLDEQKQIVLMISSVQTTWQYYQSYLINLLNIKKGLMQDLLTGKVRVKQTSLT